MKKTKVVMNKPVYLGFTSLDLSKIEMYVFLLGCIEEKYVNKAKLCYIGTDSFIIHIKT